MRRADRLFQIIQILRRSSRPVTAAEIAAELEVSPRTIYRDVADLVGQRVPVSGEAGLGYILDDAFDMPPLMLTPDEIEAAVIGAQWVATQGDEALARAAQDLVAKITAVVPEGLRGFVTSPTISVPAFRRLPPDGLDIAATRAAIRDGRKMKIAYRDAGGLPSDRVVWPVVIGLFDHARMLAAWCELRQDFRHFRADRIATATFLEDAHGTRPGVLRQRWKRHMADRKSAPPRR